MSELTTKSLIDEMCQGYVDRKEIAGISAYVIKEGQCLYRGNFGMADYAEEIPITDETIFRIYSMTKPVTAAAALMLLERGAFDLDDPVSKYIPKFKHQNYLVDVYDPSKGTLPCKGEVTIRHLFTMTSGMAYDFGDTALVGLYQQKFGELAPRWSQLSTLEFIEAFSELPLAFEPGTDYMYSFSIDVLGALIEIWSGMKLSEFLKKELFDPLDMEDTGFWVPKKKMHRFAELYFWNESELVPVSGVEQFGYYRPPVVETGGGGLVSTVSDYLKFTQMLLNEGKVGDKRILKEETVEMMRTNQLSGKALSTFSQFGKPGYGYGLGVRTMMDPSKADFVAQPGEWGWDGAASTWMCIDPENQMTAVFMVQLFPYCRFPAQQEFIKLLYEGIHS